MDPAVTRKSSQGILFSSWTIFSHPLTGWSLFWIDEDGNEEEIKISHPHVPLCQQQHRSWLRWMLRGCRNFSSHCWLLGGLAGDRTTKSSLCSPPWAWSAMVYSRLFKCRPSSGGRDVWGGNISSSRWQLLPSQHLGGAPGAEATGRSVRKPHR